jgi:hypothetical protein
MRSLGQDSELQTSLGFTVRLCVIVKRKHTKRIEKDRVTKITFYGHNVKEIKDKIFQTLIFQKTWNII